MALKGLIAAPHTPTRADFSLNLDCVPAQAAHLARDGVVGVFVGGTTGEGFSFSTDERAALFGAWGEAAKAHGLKFFAHVGHNNLPEARQLVEAAVAAEADAIAAMAPFFFKPATEAALVEWFAAIAKSAEETPFYYYDIPGFTGVVLDTAEVIERATEAIPDFAGVKYTNPDLELFERCFAQAGDRIDLLFGTDEKLLEGMQRGSVGAVGSSYNYAAKLYLKIIEAFERGDLETAQMWQARSVQMIDVIAAHNYCPAAKAVMRMVGVDCGPARAPLATLSEAERKLLRGELEALGFFEWIG